MAQAYVGFSVSTGEFYFYAAIQKTTLANALDALLPSTVNIPSWLGEISLAGYDTAACAEAEEAGNAGDLACAAVFSVATVPAEALIHRITLTQLTLCNYLLEQ